MGRLDYATIDVDGIVFVNDRYDASANVNYYKTRPFVNPDDGKGMYLEAGRSDELHEWQSISLWYDGASNPIRQERDVYSDTDLLAFIADVERDELGNASVKKLLE